MIALGDFVTVGTVPDNQIAQGVFIQDNGDGTIWLLTEPDPRYGGFRVLCFQANAVKIQDRRLFLPTLKFVQWVRERIASDWSLIS
jgi:hypothetical protein